jgi:hypothetical protein
MPRFVLIAALLLFRRPMHALTMYEHGRRLWCEKLPDEGNNQTGPAVSKTSIGWSGDINYYAER